MIKVRNNRTYKLKDYGVKMKIKILKIGVSIIWISVLFVYFRANALDEICKQKIHGLNKVPEICGVNKEWEWYDTLEWFTLNTVVYDNEFLKENIERIDITFFNNKREISIFMSAYLSKADKVCILFLVDYDGKNKELIYNPISIAIGPDNGCAKFFKDEESICKYLNKYGVTKENVNDYYEYLVYDVVVKTWVKAHKGIFKLEKWKLMHCKIIDNSFSF